MTAVGTSLSTARRPLTSGQLEESSHQSYWQMAAGDECTNYVAHVESAVFRAPAPDYLLGNAGQWPASAAAHGVTVNGVPSVGAVAEWDAGAFGMGDEGHVAVVEKVGPHDSYILISQQHISSDVDGYDWTRINAGYPADSWQPWPSHFIHFPVKGSASVGVYDATTGVVSVRDTPAAGPASLTFRVARPGDVPLAGDWTGTGTDRVGYYDPQDGSFHLRDYLSSGPAQVTFSFGPPGMIPLAGNWGGGAKSDIGFYNPRSGWFHLRAGLATGPVGYLFAFGPREMTPLAADWLG